MQTERHRGVSVRRKDHRITILLVLLSTLAAGPAVAGPPAAGRPPAGERSLIFGFLPIQSTQRLTARFGPFVDYLAARLGVPVRMETAPDYAEFVRRTGRERRYDILFTAPHFYWLAQREAGYRVIVRVAAPTMRAIIVVPVDSDIRDLQDLRGRTLATVDPLALGTVLVRDWLTAHGLDPDHDVVLVPTPTHNASLLSAYKGATDAAALMIPPFRHARAEVREGMRILARTDGVPHMPIAVAQRLPPDRVAALRDILLAMDEDPEGRALLARMRWPGFVAADPAEYEVLAPIAEQVRRELE